MTATTPPSTQDNPCLACSVNQGCCSQLEGLRLSPSEYARHFAGHADALIVNRDGPQFKVTSKAGPCPNWQDRCTVYETRPMECRLFPVTVSNAVTVGETAVVVAHDRTRCPQKTALRPTDAEAVVLIEGFVADIYGPTMKTKVVFDAGAASAVALGVKVLNRLQRRD